MGAEFSFVENKRNRLVDSEDDLGISRRLPETFLRRYITADEPWIHYCTQEAKEQSQTGSEEGKDGKISRQGDVHCLWWIIYMDDLGKGTVRNLKVM